MHRNTVILLFITVLVSFSTVVTFPEITIRGRSLGSKIWNINLGGIRTQRVLDIKKGLDLQGGVQVVYAVDMSSIEDSDRQDAFEGVKAVIERRVNFFGVSEANIQTARAGEDYRIIVELPGVTDVEQALTLIGKTAQLDFREQSDDAEAEEQFAKTALTGAHLKKSSVQFDPNTGEAVVALRFNEAGTDLFREITERNLNKPLAIYIDDFLLTAPTVSTAISDGKAVITGQFTPDQAKNLSIQLNSGALPAPVSVKEQRTIGASLGEESVKKSVIAGLAGLSLVVVFMWSYYGSLGFLACLALLAYALITIMLYKLIPVTLTLSGVAGFILSVGMAVDANILIFERYREEIREGLPSSLAIEKAFGRAWDSIRDANVNTLIIAFILFNPFNWSFLNSSGIIRGFALTLSLGILVSLFTGVVIVRTLIRVFYSGSEGMPLQKQEVIKKGGNIVVEPA